MKAKTEHQKDTNSINKLNAGIQSTQTVEEKSIMAKERVTLLNSNIDKVSIAATNLTQLATQIEIVSNEILNSEKKLNDKLTSFK